MSRSTSNRTADPQAPATQSQASLIAAGTRMQGEIGGSVDLVIEGGFEGTIRLDSAVVVGREGKVKGEISGRSVRILGHMNGDVHGKEVVEVAASGVLEGNVSAARVIIAEGAFFKGKVEMTGKSEASKKGSPPPPAEPKRDS